MELRRWTTQWLVEALGRAGFAEVRATAHPGEAARRFARELLAHDAMDAVAPTFEQVASALGASAGSLPGDEMVLAVR